MPMYEYRCNSCGKVFERYSAGRRGQDGAEGCPACGKGHLKKQFSTFASACCSSSGGSLPGAGGCGGGSSQFS
jgi:putative FmdB family regulatory protein